MEITERIFRISKLMRFNKIDSINRIKNVKRWEMRCHHFRLLSLAWD